MGRVKASVPPVGNTQRFYCRVLREDVLKPQCQELCKAAKMNSGRCVPFQCRSPWRICIICVMQGYAGDDRIVVDAATGLCVFHAKNGKNANRRSVVRQPVPSTERKVAVKISVISAQEQSRARAELAKSLIQELRETTQHMVLRRARIIQRLGIECGYAKETIAKAWGLSASLVSNTERMLKLPAAILDRFFDESIPEKRRMGVSTGIKFLSSGLNPDQMERVAEIIFESPFTSFASVAKMVSEQSTPDSPATPPAPVGELPLDVLVGEVVEDHPASSTPQSENRAVAINSAGRADELAFVLESLTDADNALFGILGMSVTALQKAVATEIGNQRVFETLVDCGKRLEQVEELLALVRKFQHS